MNGEVRRKEIVKRLAQADAPISATVLAAEFGVSRQIIVQDIALPRGRRSSLCPGDTGWRKSPLLAAPASGCIR